MNHHRNVNGDEVIYYLKTLERGTSIRYAEVSMSNGFGLRLIYKWIGISFLQLQRENIMNHLETNGSETKIMTMELDVYQQSNEANYDIFLSRLSQQRRTDAENKSVAPTLPLPLLNKPSPNVKEIKSPVETQNQKLVDSKTQDIAQKMFPANKPQIIQAESSKEVKICKEEPVIKIPTSGNINNLDDFVPDDVLDKSFLEDAGHGDIIAKVSKETDLDSEESDVDSGNPMVAGYQADIDPDDFSPAVVKMKIENDHIESNNPENWSAIQNTTRPRPEGGEDEDSKPQVDGLNKIDSKKGKEKKKARVKVKKRIKRRPTV